MYSVVGQGNKAAASSGFCFAALWNPHASQSILVVQVSFCNTASAAGTRFITLRRITARGTPATTVTPDIYSHHIQGVAPPSGALLDLGTYTVEPTSETPYDWGLAYPPLLGAGSVFPIPGGIIVPPGAGLGLFGEAPEGITEDVSFSWLEDWDEGTL